MKLVSCLAILLTFSISGLTTESELSAQFLNRRFCRPALCFPILTKIKKCPSHCLRQCKTICCSYEPDPIDTCVEGQCSATYDGAFWIISEDCVGSCYCDVPPPQREFVPGTYYDFDCRFEDKHPKILSLNLEGNSRKFRMKATEDIQTFRFKVENIDEGFTYEVVATYNKDESYPDPAPISVPIGAKRFNVRLYGKAFPFFLGVLPNQSQVIAFKKWHLTVKHVPDNK